MTFEEIVTQIDSAIKFVESEVNQEFEKIVEEYYESLPFVAGHIMGMRDAMILVQSVLQKTMFGGEMFGEEEWVNGLEERL